MFARHQLEPSARNLLRSINPIPNPINKAFSFIVIRKKAVPESLQWQVSQKTWCRRKHGARPAIMSDHLIGGLFKYLIIFHFTYSGVALAAYGGDV
jgi:hypothetical protein